MSVASVAKFKFKPIRPSPNARLEAKSQWPASHSWDRPLPETCDPRGSQKSPHPGFVPFLLLATPQDYLNKLPACPEILKDSTFKGAPVMTQIRGVPAIRRTSLVGATGQPRGSRILRCKNIAGSWGRDRWPPRKVDVQVRKGVLGRTACSRSVGCVIPQGGETMSL